MFAALAHLPARVAVALLLGAPAALHAQQVQTPPPDSTPRGPVSRARAFPAVQQALLVNVFVNRLDVCCLDMPTQRVSLNSWSRNLRAGWEWDENQFGTNLFMHPYHGSLYFNAGRSRGMGFWESAPLSFLGSWTWEFLGENNRPALNDFFMTSFGGIALGEMFHRLTAMIRDNQAHGGRRLRRELATLPLDPIGGLNRFLGRRRVSQEPNPPEHTPGLLVVRLHAGARILSDSLIKTAGGLPTVMMDLVYGDPWLEPYHKPFDAFIVRAAIGEGGINLLRASGRLYGKEMTGPEARHRHLFQVNQRFDYASNSAYHIGGQSVEFGISSRWRLSRNVRFRTQVYLDGIILGGIDAPGTGVGERTYDFGPGVGIRLQGVLEIAGVPFVVYFLQSEYVHAVSGASADHYVEASGLELTLPVTRRFGLTAQGIDYGRLSRYSDRPDQERQFPEVRVLLSWTWVSRQRTPQ